MTISITHLKVAGGSDSANSQSVQPSDWNAGLVTSMATNRLVGRTTASVGSFEEISVGATLTFSGQILSANTTYFNNTYGRLAAVNSWTANNAITNGGYLIIGNASPVTTRQGTTSVTAQVQIPSTGAGSSFLVARYSADAFAPRIYFAKSRNASIGDHTTLSTGDTLGEFSFAGSNGTQMNQGASITVNTTGAAGTEYYPAEINFLTSTGSAMPSQRLKIGNTAITTTGIYVAPLGANSAPTYTFTGDNNTGMWSSGADTLNFSVGGVNRVSIDSSGRLTASYGVTIDGGTLTLDAGTTSIAPLTFQSGILNTTPQAGAVEYSGNLFYISRAASNRSIIPAYQFVTTTSDTIISNINTAQSIFAASNDTLTLEGSTMYRFNARLFISTGTTSHTNAIGFAGTATINSIRYKTSFWMHNGTALITTAPTVGVVSATTATVISPAVTTSNFVVIELDGLMRITTGGTFIPQITFSAAPGGTCQTRQNSFFEIWPIGGNNDVSLGPWA